MNKIFKMIKKIFKPNLIILKKYKIVFVTLDDKEHEFNRLNYIDENAISCSVGKYYLIEKHFLEDDDENIYPIENILKIRFDLVDTIENAIEKYMYGDVRHVWYSKDMIEMYLDEA